MLGWRGWRPGTTIGSATAEPRGEEDDRAHGQEQETVGRARDRQDQR